MPNLDTDRATYGMRESGIGDMFVAVMGLAKTSQDALKIKHYRKGGMGVARGRGEGDRSTYASGDFPAVVYEVCWIGRDSHKHTMKSAA